MPSPADALTALRLGAAVAMPRALADGGALPPLLWLVAAATDLLDGPLARRVGSSRHGAVLDPIADVTFLFATFVTLAAMARVPWIVPAAIAASVASYALATIRGTRAAGELRLARSPLGHVAGVVNWAGAGVVTAAVAWPASPAARLVPAACVAIVAVNVAAAAERSLRRQLARRST